jgi:hypothetical protein
MQPESHQQEPNSGWQYNAESTLPSAPAPTASKSTATISWTASEFIANHKNFGWYAKLGLAGLAGVIVMFVLTRDVISAVVVAIVVGLLGVLANHKPRTLQYEISSTGIHIGQHNYTYKDFKSFSVIDEGALSSISLFPTKRFMPPISIYYDPKDEERIAGVLGSYLPFIEGKKDAVDRFMNRIHF